VKHVLDDLTAYLDGALGPRERAHVDAHLEACASCRASRDRLAGALSVLARLPPAPAPSDEFEQRFYARLAAERRVSPGRPRLRDWLTWRWAAPALATAAAAVMLVVTTSRQRAHERALAEHLDLLENYEVVASVGAVETPEDAEVVAHLDQLEGRR
jgi:anti-sigma factor RsiW